MLKKKVNGAWENVKNVLKRKTNGSFTDCTSLKKKYNGVWSSVLTTSQIWITPDQFMTESGGIPTSDEYDRMKASYTQSTTDFFDDGVPYVRMKLGSRTGAITCSYRYSINSPYYYDFGLNEGEKLNFEYRFSCSGSSYFGRIVVVYWDNQRYERISKEILKTYSNQQNFQTATFTAPVSSYDIYVFMYVGNSNSSCPSSNYGILDFRNVYEDSYIYQLRK